MQHIFASDVENIGKCRIVCILCPNMGYHTFLWVDLKIEIHAVHHNLRNPLSVNGNPTSATKSISMKRKLIGCLTE